MKPFRLLQLLAFLVLGNGVCCAQNELRGRLLDKQDRHPVVGATIIATSVDSLETLAFAISDADGSFLLKGRDWPDSISVTVRSLETKLQSSHVSSDIGYMEFMLEEESYALNEISVKAPKIRQSGDTINYYVSSYADSLDRTVGDILRKLPGIQVLSSGKILYQNKEISKFYIEDLDLLQGKYAVVTNNMDASKVSTIQILENHQSKKVLKGLELPEAAAINLKLKDSSKGALFGSFQLGIGGGDNLLTSNEAVGMRFTKSQQDIALYKGDNTGRDPADELTSQYADDSAPDINLFPVLSSLPDMLDKRRALFNKSHAVALCDLRLLGQGLVLTSNLTLLDDIIDKSNIRTQNVFLPSDTICIAESLSSMSRQRGIGADISLEKNSDSVYFDNKVHIQLDGITGTDEIVADATCAQTLKTSKLTLDDNFSYIFKKGSHTFRMESAFDFFHYSPSLQVFSGLSGLPFVSDSNLSQDAEYNRIEASTSLREYFDLGNGWYWSYQVGLYGHNYSLSSIMRQGEDVARGDSLQNELIRNRFGILGNVGMGYGGKRYSGALYVPLDVFLLSRKNNIMSSGSEKFRVLPSPSFYAEYRKARHTLRLDVSYRKRMAEIEDEMTGYLLESYRSIRRSTGVLPESSKASMELGYSYKNPELSFFTSLTGGYGMLRKNTLMNLYYNGIFLQSCNKQFYNNSNHLFLATDWSKGFSHTTIKLNARWQEDQSEVLCQNVVADCNSQTLTVTPSLTSMIGRHVAVSYNATYRDTRYSFNTTSSKRFFFLNHTISSSYMPVRGFVFKSTLTQVYGSQFEKAFVWLGDMGVSYKKKRFEFMLDWTNIFNSSNCSTYICNDISSISTTYLIRPREILFTMKYHL